MRCPSCGEEDTATIMTDHYGRPYCLRIAATVLRDEPRRLPGLYVPDGSFVTGWICAMCGNIQLTADTDDIHPADPGSDIPKGPTEDES